MNNSVLISAAGVVVAAIVAVLVARYTQRAIDRRDALNWRRDKLMTLVSDLLKLSIRRQSQLYEDYDIALSPFRNFPKRTGPSTSALVLEMELTVGHLRLFNEKVAAAGQAIHTSHKAAESRAAELDPGLDNVSLIEELIAENLEALHDTLITEFQKAIIMQNERHSWWQRLHRWAHG